MEWLDFRFGDDAMLSTRNVWRLATLRCAKVGHFWLLLCLFSVVQQTVIRYQSDYYYSSSGHYSKAEAEADYSITC